MLHVVGTSGWTAGCGEAPEHQVDRLMCAGEGAAASSAPLPHRRGLGSTAGVLTGFLPSWPRLGRPNTPFLFSLLTSKPHRGFSLASRYGPCVCPQSHV